MMDKITTVSGVLFTIADVFAIVSLIQPDWIVTEIGGKKSKATTGDSISCFVIFVRLV